MSPENQNSKQPQPSKKPAVAMPGTSFPNRSIELVSRGGKYATKHIQKK